MAAKQKVYSRGDALYHPSHGLCVVRGIEKNPGLGGDGQCYQLEQKDPDKSRAKFTVLVSQIRAAGFHELMTLKTANQLLDFWKKQDEVKVKADDLSYEYLASLERESTPEALAEILWLFSRRKQEKFSAEERKLFKYTTNMLVRELAYVWQIPEEDALARVCKELRFELPALSLTK